MATLAKTHPTLLDVARRSNPDGSIAKVAEILSESNEVLDDAVFIECNNGTGHKTTVRTGLPTPTWRKLYGGVQPTKSTTAQIEDSCGMLETYAEIDKALADINGNTAAWRLSEETAFIEGMSQELADTFWYGNTATAPEEFMGMSPRYNSLSAANGDNIFKSGTTPDFSIWLIGWGPNTVHMIYPNGSVGGLQMTDKGQVTIEDASGGSNTGRMEAYRTHYRQDAGLTVRDWRFAARIQVDESEIVKDAASGPDLIELMAQAQSSIPRNKMGARFAWYTNRVGIYHIRRQSIHAVASSTLSIDMIDGQRVMTYGGYPLRQSDALALDENTSAPISA